MDKSMRGSEYYCGAFNCVCVYASWYSLMAAQFVIILFIY